MTTETLALIGAHLTLFFSCIAQNTAFSIVSRSRNRNHINYHIFASVLSNGVWFLTFRQLVTANMTWAILPTYVAGTVIGSVVGVKISMWIEKLLGADSDSHLAAAKK